MPAVTMLGGRYRIDGLIGRGGMATVWRATDTVLDREVAVKRLHARLHGDDELEERFKREGRLVANLSHPNVVRLLDQGGEDDEPFLVFELVDGQDLKTILRQHGRMAPERAAAVVAQIARGLAMAHRAGVVHRDIKSHNVLVTKEGAAKLTDFGIARIVEADGDLTRTGIVIGSSDYLSPEQAEGKPLDGRSDIYSLGVVLFEALTGKLPFAGENPVAVATKHVYEDPPDPRQLVPEVPHHLATSCLKALEKDPRRRFSSGDSFAEALSGGPIEEVLHHEDDGGTTGRLTAIAGPARRGGRRRWPWIVGAVAVLAALAAAAGIWGPDLLDGDGTGTPAAGTLVSGLVPASYDPLGDEEEHESELPRLVDDDPATEWSTEAYPLATFGTKTGVGVNLPLPRAARVTRVVVTSSVPGAVVRILGSGTTLPARATISGDVTLGPGATTIPVNSTAAQSDVVVWIAALPQDQDGKYRARIGQVEVYAAAN